MEREDLYRKINRIFLITYFFLLILVQVTGIFSIIVYYKVMGIEFMLIIVIFITLVWPIVLSIILRKFFSRLAKVREEKLYKE